MIIKPFNHVYFILLALIALIIFVFTKAFKNKDKKQRDILIVSLGILIYYYLLFIKFSYLKMDMILNYGKNYHSIYAILICS